MNYRAALILIAAMLAGCATSYDYYKLKTEVPLTAFQVQQSVGLIPADIPGWLNDARLSWSDGEVKVFRAENDRWGTDLGQEVDRTLSENLSQQLGGAAVTIGPWFGDQRPDLAVKVDLDNLVMVDKVVEVTARWKLLNKKGKILVQSDEQVIWIAETESQEQSLRLALGISQALAGMSADIVEAVRNVAATKLTDKKMEP
ncbi:PqiC family protein [Sansalvadorimonas sp. 2012CJ34-2]|uniref:PqiC family protein n=1 Tax=Parendozoicomonas callyspongiae TaxID=2942213 RepID=A0ABT0PED1_9GAMM|nr:PqiC family protein [Sansalvadorimonas sp. 2012CJ34-2]MCL6269137.1 PqiC family protein [Sansalvadorimonas sp. 2012CJ34-2]